MDDERNSDAVVAAQPRFGSDPRTSSIEEIFSIIAERQSAVGGPQAAAIVPGLGPSASVVPTASVLPARLVVQRAGHSPRKGEQPPEILAALPVAASPLFPGQPTRMIRSVLRITS
jgi:hypothetical protein